MPLSMNSDVNVGGINKIANKSVGMGTCIIAIITKKQTGIMSNGRTFCSIFLIDLMPKIKTGIIIDIKNIQHSHSLQEKSIRQTKW